MICHIRDSYLTQLFVSNKMMQTKISEVTLRKQVYVITDFGVSVRRQAYLQG